MTKQRRILEDTPINKETLDLDTLGWNLTTEDLMQRFGVALMTVYIWRTKKGLPYLEIPTASGTKMPIRFNEDQVQKWADSRGIMFHSNRELHSARTVNQNLQAASMAR